MEKVLYCFYKISLKIRANLKHHNRLYILSSRHSYRPMRVHVVAHLFYNMTFLTDKRLNLSICHFFSTDIATLSLQT